MKKIYILKVVFAFFFLLLFSNNFAFAETVYSEDFVTTNTNKFEFTGNTPGEQFGSFINSGDFNGDMVNDLIVSSPFFSSPNQQWNGAVYIFFGQKQNKFPNPSLTPNIVIYGVSSGDQLGTSVEVGDYNNDKIDDIAISAYNGLYNDRRPGLVYVIYGDSFWDNQLTNHPLDLDSFKPNSFLTGQVEKDSFGLSMHTMDINNDNIDDLLIGAPFASTEVLRSGLVYAYFGNKNGISYPSDLTFPGQIEDERFGSSITGGDFNGDNKNEVVIGAYFSNVDNSTQAGKVYIYKSYNKDGKKLTYTPINVIKGSSFADWFGFALSKGDINGDNKDDLIISSFPYAKTDSVGKISVFLGSKNFLYKEKVLNENYAFTGIDMGINENLYNSLLGASIFVKDLNADGNAEIIAGAPNITGYSLGNVYIIDYFNNKISVIHGENTDDWFGYALNAQDFDSDGNNDLIIGSRYSDGPNSLNNGKIFVMLGNSLTFGNEKNLFNLHGQFVTRGELISDVVNTFNLKEKKKDFIENCYQHLEFCLFNFMAMSSYDDIKFEPDVILYSDVPITQEYYEEITSATMLGIINGYLNEEGSPFHPDQFISRIQALKIILSATSLVAPKYEFELIKELGSVEKLTSQSSYFADINPKISYMWWYPRYVNFAVEKNIINTDDELFRPDDNITVEELKDVINRTLDYLNSLNEETNS